MFLAKSYCDFRCIEHWGHQMEEPSSMPDISSLLPPKLDALAIGLGCPKWREREIEPSRQ